MSSNPENPILPVEDRLDVLPYVNRKHLELSNKYSRSKKIYLDTKYWLMLRDHRLGRAKIPEAAKLHDALVHGVLENIFVCPISATTWLEILSQTDPTTLRASAKLIDDLSLGLSIIEERQRIAIEIKHFLYHGLFKKEHLHPLESLVWTKVGYILGFTTPVNEKLSPELDIALQRKFFDFMWSTTFIDFLTHVGDKIASFPRNSQDVSPTLNAGKIAHLNDCSSYKELFLEEIAGILDTYSEVIDNIIFRSYESTYRTKATRPPEGDALRVARNVIYNLFKLNKINDHLPSINVSARLHSAWRWNKNRRFKKNDLHDFHHATAAIPYCDIFLTERSLKHLLTQESVGLTRLFKCNVISDPKEAISVISGLGEENIHN